jgi:3-hydroxyacyl-CoA dehydrogenase / enoyl-CoA hydratase / 3-hydroxybutyryl-CoA epimerase
MTEKKINADSPAEEIKNSANEADDEIKVIPVKKPKTASRRVAKKTTDTIESEEFDLSATAEVASSPSLEKETKPMTSDLQEKPQTSSPEGQFLALETDNDGIAFAWFDTPGKKVNLLSPEMLDEIENVINEISANPAIKAVIFASRKADNFIAGADLASMVSGSFDLDKAVAFGNRGRELFQRLAELEVATIACIHGTCLGGGLELALACDYRIASNHPKTKLGLPEVQLGILPGWGGVSRLPRMLPLPAALDLMLTGKQVPAKKARSLGLIHLAPPQEILIKTALKLAKDVLAGDIGYLTAKQPKSSLLDKALSNLAVGQNLVFKQARKGVLEKSKGFYPSPLKILETVQNSLNLPLYEALKLEGQGFKYLLERSETSNLMNLFFVNQELNKVPELEGKSIKPRKIKLMGVLGAGYMGAGIAQVSNAKDIDIRLKDVSYPALLAGIKAIQKSYGSLLKRRRLTQKQVTDKMRRVTPTIDYSGFKHTDLVIEAVVEKMEVKKAVFQELEKHIGPDTILASNTSALSINEMAASTSRPDRFVGLHFFGPVNKMPLVEVILGEKTSDQTLSTALNYVRGLGKTPVVIRKDKPGFVVNRILAVYGNEAGLLLEEGGDMTTIDRLMTDFGMPMGIFEVIDLAGIDVAWHTALSVKPLLEARPGFVMSRVMERLFQDQRLGQKNGKGFYIHSGKEAIPDHRYIQQVVQELNPTEIERRSLTGEEIRDRLVLSILNEAALCLEEGLVARPGEIDMAMLMGTGFPPFRGGPLRLIDQQGIQFIVNQLEYYAETRGERFAPCSLLKEMAQSGKKFYPLF